MKKFLLPFIVFITFFFTACGESDVPPTEEKCNPVCEEWQDCNSGNCEIAVDRCEKTEDCKNNTEKPVCDINTHNCVAEEEPECIGLSFEDIRVGTHKNELVSLNGDFQFLVGFYDADSPVAQYDLGVGNNINYSTCNQCVTVNKFNGETLEKIFFQKSGYLDITEGDGRQGESVGEITNIKLIEVTIDTNTWVSTPVENGECIEIETGKSWKWNTLCEEGTRRCNSDDNTIEICEADHSWKVESACLETEECTIDVENGIYCKPAYCNIDEKRCNENGNIQICKDDGQGNLFWDIFENCTNGMVCDDESLICIVPPCNNGDKKCNADSTGIKTCEDEVWVETLCAVDSGEQCIGSGDDTKCDIPSIDTEWMQVSANSVQTCGIKVVDGVKKLYCWGTGSSGRLGTGDEEDKLVPTEVSIADNSGWSDISVGDFHACGIKDSSVYCWGKNDRGQLGIGNNDQKLVPTKISDDNDWINIESGGYHNCALKNNGKLYCWGRGDYGQLGNGDSENLTAPVEVSGENSGWESFSLGDKHSCGLRYTNGVKKIYCWGYNMYGRLGIAIDDVTDRDVPTEVYADNSDLNKDWVSLNSGFDSNCAIKTTGKMYCWGHGNSYKLGTGNEDNQEIPFEISGDNWVLASMSSFHSCGIKEVNGVNKAFCWGRGSKGRLGTDNEDDQTMPTEVSGDDWFYISSGSSHNCGFKVVDGKKQLNCWGNGSKGRLGTGDEENKLTPTIIP